MEIESVEVAVRFSFAEDEKKSLPSYRDTLFIDQNEYDKFSDKDVQKLAQERYDAWAEHILNPPEPEAQPEISALDAAQQALDAARQLADQASAVIADAQSQQAARNAQAVNTLTLPDN